MKKIVDISPFFCCLIELSYCLLVCDKLAKIAKV